MMYQLTLIILMILSSFGMIKAYMAHKTAGAVWGRPVSGLFGVLAVLLAVMHLVYISRQDDIRLQTAVDRHYRETYRKMRDIGDYIGNNYGNARILLIKRAPDPITKERHGVIMQGFREGLRGRTRINAIVAPEDHTHAPAAVAGVEPHDPFTPEYFNHVLSVHGDCDLIVSLIGLPDEFWKIRALSSDGGSRTRLVTLFGDVFFLEQYIRSGAIAEAIINAPKVRSGADLSGLRSADRGIPESFIHIHEKNIDRVKEKYRGLFAGPQDLADKAAEFESDSD